MQVDFLRPAIVSVLLHIAIISAIALGAFARGCKYRSEPVKIEDFTVAIATEAEAFADRVEEKPAESLPEPPRPDDIAEKKPKPQPKKKTEIKKGKRVVRKIPQSANKAQNPPLSEAEIKKWLDRGAKIGDKTSIPENEASMNGSILMGKLYDSWLPPPKEASGRRPATVVFDIGEGGRLSGPSIEISSGSVQYDKSCLEAVSRAGRVSGLSAEFIRHYGKRCRVVFKQKD